METIVKITWDEPQMKEWLCAENIKIALSAYCKNTQFEVKDIELTMPRDEEIQELTFKDAKEREVLCYDGHELIMKAGIKCSSKPAVAMLEIKHCKYCPFAETKRYWTEDSWEEAYDWHCKKANGKKIQGCVEWHEIKDMTIPEWCPLTK